MLIGQERNDDVGWARGEGMMLVGQGKRLKMVAGKCFVLMHRFR